MDKKWAEKLMRKGVEGDGSFRWSLFVLYSRALFYISDMIRFLLYYSEKRKVI